MGWLFYGEERSPHTEEQERKVIEGLTTWDTANGTGTCLAACKVGDVWYCAVRATFSKPSLVEPYIPAKDGSITFAAIFLTALDGRQWGYKDMEETSGPNRRTCPESILSLLSEIDPDATGKGAVWARNWRAQCRGLAA